MVDLPAPDRPVNQSTHGFWPFSAGARGLVDLERLPVDVGARGAAPKSIMPGADRGVGEAVDQDEAARVAVLGVGIEGDRLGRVEIAEADFVELQRLAGDVLERVDVDLVLELGDRGGRRSGSPIFSR